jgi:hypothetical protein
MNTAAFILVALLNPASAPTSQPAKAPQTKVMGQQGVIHRGAPFTLKKSITMDALAGAVDTYANKTVQVTGKVAAVCIKKGCWMALAGKKKHARARITFKDYGFFVPLNCKDSKATVEGTVQVKKMSEAERAHIAKDAGKPISEIPQSELRLVATGVKLVR